MIRTSDSFVPSPNISIIIHVDMHGFSVHLGEFVCLFQEATGQIITARLMKAISKLG
jgi:hypothetical protein